MYLNSLPHLKAKIDGLISWWYNFNIYLGRHRIFCSCLFDRWWLFDGYNRWGCWGSSLYIFFGFILICKALASQFISFGVLDIFRNRLMIFALRIRFLIEVHGVFLNAFFDAE